MNTVANDETSAEWARVRERQRLQDLADHAAAARALRSSAKCALEEIERRVALPSAPQGDPRRLPTGGPHLAERFLWAATTYLRMHFAAVVVVLDGNYVGPLLSSVPGRKSTDLHFMFGEGPAIEAGTSGTFIEVRDFREEAWRWPAFAPAALDMGFRSGWWIPLPDPEKSGLVLCLGGRDPISFTLPRFERLTRVTRIAQSLLIDHPATITTQTIARRIEQSVRDRAVIYQASGVLSERLSIDCESALGLMRLQAWAERRPLQEVASELMGVPPDGDPDGSAPGRLPRSPAG